MGGKERVKVGEEEEMVKAGEEEERVRVEEELALIYQTVRLPFRTDRSKADRQIDRQTH